jgi:hypothetical protein
MGCTGPIDTPGKWSYHFAILAMEGEYGNAARDWK